MPDATDSFDEPPHAFDEMKLPFIFVPHGAPEPTEWLERHRDYIKLPATFVPHARSDRRSAPSSGSPSPGQRRSADGRAAPSDPGAPWPPVSNAMSDATSAGMNETADRAWTPDDPIAAFLRANDALATTASGNASGRAGGLHLDPDVQNDSLNVSATTAYDPSPLNDLLGSLAHSTTTAQIISGSRTGGPLAGKTQLAAVDLGIQSHVDTGAVQPVNYYTSDINNSTAHALGMSRNQLRTAIHSLKDAAGLGGADNVVIHIPSGEVFFNGGSIGSLNDE
jgi:hypothetical protein